MALLTITTIADEGTSVVYAAVAASDTIDVNSLGSYGYLLVKGGSGSDTVTVVDSSKSDAGNVAVSDSKAVPATTGLEGFRIRRELADANGIVTVTHSAPTGVTYALIRLA